MGRLFGTDGARGVANSELTCELAMKIGRATAMVLTDSAHKRPRVLIGMDTRASSEMLESAISAGLCSVGADVLLLGVVPTPAVAFLVQKYKYDAGIMISASHNPCEYNGIKIFKSDGYKLPDALEEEIEAIILDETVIPPVKIGGDVGRVTTSEMPIFDYITHLCSTVDYRFNNMRIALDCANGSASITAPEFFMQMGAECDVLSNEPDGVNINDNCGSTHPRRLCELVRELGADASFNGRNDLLIDGRKFSGNAQYRLGDCIVHHGSLLYDTNIEQMVASTTVDPYKILSKSIKSVRDRVTNISEHLPRRLSVEEFKSCMVRHLMRGSTDTYTVTPEDDARINQLAQEKFAAWDAIYGKNPRFNLERTGRFPGGKLTFRLDVQRGVIRSASVWGDFFSTLSAEAITGALTGCRYDRAAVLDALRKNGIDGAVYQISAADMAALIAD